MMIALSTFIGRLQTISGGMIFLSAHIEIILIFPQLGLGHW
jgi:hypothetical protein